MVPRAYQSAKDVGYIYDLIILPSDSNSSLSGNFSFMIDGIHSTDLLTWRSQALAMHQDTLPQQEDSYQIPNWVGVKSQEQRGISTGTAAWWSDSTNITDFGNYQVESQPTYLEAVSAFNTLYSHFSQRKELSEFDLVCLCYIQERLKFSGIGLDSF